VSVILGGIFISQALIKPIARFYLRLILSLMKSDQTLQPLIEKNFDNHEVKSMKANLLYTVLICFLVFSGSNFMSTSQYLIQLQDIIFGGDMALRHLDPTKKTVLDEYKIREMLD